jgi:hypothetical protein
MGVAPLACLTQIALTDAAPAQVEAFETTAGAEGAVMVLDRCRQPGTAVRVAAAVAEGVAHVAALQ